MDFSKALVIESEKGSMFCPRAICVRHPSRLTCYEIGKVWAWPSIFQAIYVECPEIPTFIYRWRLCRSSRKSINRVIARVWLVN